MGGYDFVPAVYLAYYPAGIIEGACATEGVREGCGGGEVGLEGKLLF